MAVGPMSQSVRDASSPDLRYSGTFARHAALAPALRMVRPSPTPSTMEKVYTAFRSLSTPEIVSQNDGAI